MPIINEPRVRPVAGADALGDVAGRATAAERAGEWEQAAELYASTFRSALAARQSERAADALRGQARMRLQLGRAEEAEELAELSLELAAGYGLRHAVARGLNVLGLIRHARGESQAAQELFGTALEMALDLGDDELVGLACQNLGVLANLRGDYREARSRYLEGIGSFVRSGSTASAMLAYNNLGSASADLREWMEAEVFFMRGLEIAERLNHTPSAGMLYSNLAEPLIRVGDLGRAREALDRAQSAATQVGDQATLADVARYRALAARVGGDASSARRYAAASLEIATRHGLELERAEALCELAEVRAADGERDQAREALRDAASRFLRLGMQADAGTALARAGELEPGMV